ncbi:40S ribosomal protein S2-3-like [Quercus robur]|uniref:40S ribosomal protein S2-3-like n=1 Tax=Quercus robur TaxID=38942 RepID=UPI002163C2B6|nr:40S ribosomal protein S2-3-like [Quercus robur]
MRAPLKYSTLSLLNLIVAERGGAGGERGGFGGGRPRGNRGRGGRRRGRREEEEKWVLVTKLGHLVHSNKIRSLEQIYLHSLTIKEHQIVDKLCPGLKDEVMKIMPVQKQTRADQRTRFKAFVVVGDNNGHVRLDVKCSKEVATAIRGAIILAKLSVITVKEKVDEDQFEIFCTLRFSVWWGQGRSQEYMLGGAGL